MDLALSLDQNRPARAWDEGTSGAYEVWYGKAVALGPERNGGLWFRYTLECQGARRPPVASCWATWVEAAGAPPLHLRVDTDVPLVLPDAHHFLVGLSRSDRFLLDPDSRTWKATGNLKGPPGTSLAWDLEWEPLTPPFVYVRPQWVRRLLAPSGACTPTPHARMRGTVWVERDGVEVEVPVQDAPGMQGHIWGSRKAYAWYWAHGNDWVDGDSGAPVDAAFEVLHMLRGPRGPRLTTMWLWLDGELYERNRVTDLLPRRAWLFGDARVGNQGFGGADDLRVVGREAPPIEASFRLLPESTVEVTYHDTDGSPLRNRNATLAAADLTLDLPGGRRRLRSGHTATLEIVDRE